MHEEVQQGFLPRVVLSWQTCEYTGQEKQHIVGLYTNIYLGQPRSSISTILLVFFSAGTKTREPRSVTGPWM